MPRPVDRLLWIEFVRTDGAAASAGTVTAVVDTSWPAATVGPSSAGTVSGTVTDGAADAGVAAVAGGPSATAGVGASAEDAPTVATGAAVDGSTTG